MSLYVYAIADAPIALDDLHGVGGEALRIVANSDGASHAIAGDVDVDGPPPALTADTLRAQDALVRDLAARADALLPSRFGSRFADERALRQTLDELAPRLERALTRVRGREQMTIRLFRDEPSPAPATGPDAATRTSTNTGTGQPDDVDGHGHGSDEARGEAGRDEGPGTRYMRRRAAEARQLPEAVELLRAGLADVIEDERVERGQPSQSPLSSPSQSSQPSQPLQSRQSTPSPMIGSIHHLIPRGSAEGYRARVEEAAASPVFAASGIRLRVSGPSPAYAFAEADLS
jgi:hypothetical protein